MSVTSAVRSTLFRQLAGVAAPLAVAVASAFLFALVSAGSAVASPRLASSPLTQAELSVILDQGAQVQKIPARLEPSLRKAKDDVSLAWRDGCLLDHGPTNPSKPCVFGDAKSHTTVVLFGDSHAGAWFAGMNLVSKEHHWRLVFMGKIGCPTVSDVLVKRNDGVWYHACVTWRHNMEQRITKLHPRLLVITSSDYVGRAEPDFGKFSPNHEKTWERGVAAAFKTLHNAAHRVAFIANTPRLMEPAYRCVSEHRSDVQPCTVALDRAVQYPAARRSEFRVARSHGMAAIDPMPWFCTATVCPVIANNILIFRDSQHITPQWSQFLAPMLADALAPLVSSPSRG